MPRKLKLIIAYDGTDFAGWQRQASDRTVQAAIEDALLPIEGTPVVVIGAGRTDAGVHAAGQVASCAIENPIPRDTLLRALNARLPEDVRVMQVDDAPPAFNAQFDATQKTYRYWIQRGPVASPQMRRFVWHIPQPLDVEAMQHAAEFVVGTHDFAAFRASGSEVRTTERTIVRVALGCLPAVEKGPAPFHAGKGAGPFPGTMPADTGDLLLFEITGTGFLRHMVRNIVGTLVDIGKGRWPATGMRRILDARDRGAAGATAPAHGLVLWRVEY